MKKLTLAMAFLLAGCASVPQGVVIEQRGPKPALADAVQLAQQTLRRTLKDFDSLKDFRVLQPDLEPIAATNLGNNIEEAWLLCVEYNAKNSYGAYTGLTPHPFPMRYVAGQLTVIQPTNWRGYAGGSC